MLTTLLLIALLPSVDDFDGLRGAVVALGDIDEDGVPDLALAHRPRPFGLIDEPTENWPQVQQEPVVWLISGADGSVLHGLRGPAGFGTELAVLGDLDGDGAAELAVGDGGRGGDEGAGGVVTIVSSRTGTELTRIQAPAGVRAFGRSLAGGGQLTGDPTPDFVIGAHGGAFIFDGARLEPTWILEPRAGCRVDRRAAEGASLPSFPASERPVWPDDLSSGWGRGTYAGMNVAVVCDLDGDGLGEVALSTPREPACETNEPALLDFGQRDSRTRIVFSRGEREPLSLEAAGWCVVSGEDLDDDGLPDLVTTTVNNHTRAWSGATGELIWEVDYTGGYLHAEGTSLALTRDHDGDGVRDLAVGENETFLDADAGGLAVLSGRTGAILKRYRTTVTSQPGPPGQMVGGADVAVLADLDGDGLEAIAIWEPVPQRLLLLNGADLQILWQLDVTSLGRPE